MKQETTAHAMPFPCGQTDATCWRLMTTVKVTTSERQHNTMTVTLLCSCPLRPNQFTTNVLTKMLMVLLTVGGDTRVTLNGHDGVHEVPG